VNDGLSYDCRNRLGSSDLGFARLRWGRNVISRNDVQSTLNASFPNNTPTRLATQAFANSESPRRSPFDRGARAGLGSNKRVVGPCCNVGLVMGSGVGMGLGSFVLFCGGGGEGSNIYGVEEGGG
jgi:hypothetical protein